MKKRLLSLGLAATLGLTGGPASATGTAEEAAKLGNELTPMGSIAAGNADGSVPAWIGDKDFTCLLYTSPSPRD